MAHSSRSVLLLLLALMGICFSYSAAATFPCADSPTTFLWGERSVLKIYNFSFAVFARYPDGRVYEDANVSVSFLGLQELSRPTYENCYESLTRFPLLTAENEATPFGYVQLGDLTCEYQHSLQTASNGAVINTTSIKATWPAHPTFQLTFNLSISTKDAKIPHFYSPTQDYTLDEVYTAGGYKIAFEIINWPWEAVNTNHFVTSLWSVGASIPSDFHASAYRSGNMTFLNITTNDGVLEFLYEVDQSFLADDKILVRQLSDPVFEAPLPAGPLVLQPILGLAFCEKNPVIGNWSRLYHDPTLSVLFNPDPTTPLTPHQKSNRDLAIGLSIGLIALALIIIATIVILVWKVPKVKTFFNPYSARKGAVGSSNLK